MKPADQLRDEGGMAMVLAICLTGLLSLLGMWLLLQSKTAFRVSTATTRYESVLNLAEAALNLGLRCIKMNTPLPSSAHLNTSIPKALNVSSPSYAARRLNGGQVTPQIYYSGYDKNPNPGWMLNWQGYSAFHNVHYMCRGEGRIELPSSQGDATTAVVSLAKKVTQ